MLFSRLLSFNNSRLVCHRRSALRDADNELASPRYWCCRYETDVMPVHSHRQWMGVLAHSVRVRKNRPQTGKKPQKTGCFIAASYSRSVWKHLCPFTDSKLPLLLGLYKWAESKGWWVRSFHFPPLCSTEENDTFCSLETIISTSIMWYREADVRHKSD